MCRGRPSLISAVLAGAALVLASCGSDDPEPAATPEQDTTTTSEAPAVPDEVIVCQPGLVDTPVAVEDVPVWPGPEPVDFMDMTPASGACGTLTGEEAKTVYEAALQNPGSIREEAVEPGVPGDALWSLDTVVVWLVVEPVW